MKRIINPESCYKRYDLASKLSRYLLLYSFAVFPLWAFCQTDSLESMPVAKLESKINIGGNDTTRVKLLLALSRVTLFKSSDKNRADTAFSLMNRAEKLSNSLSYTEGQGNSLLMAALIDNYRNERDKGMIASQKALDIFKRSGNVRGIGEAYIIIGQHYRDNIPAEMAQKMSYYQMAIDQFIKANAKLRAGSASQDLGNLYVMIHKKEVGLEKMHEALTYYQSAGYKELHGLYDLIGITSAFQNDYVTGLKYELLAVKTAEAFKDSTMQVCTIYFRTGYIYFAQHEYEKADSYFKKALVIAGRYRDSASIGMLTYKRTQTLTKEKKYPQALNLIDQLMAMFPNMEADDKALDICAKLNIYFLQNRYDKAKPYISEIINLSKKINLIDRIDLPILPTLIAYNLGSGNPGHCYPYLKLMDSALRKFKMPQIQVVMETLWFKADSSTGKLRSAIVHYQKAKLINDSLYNASKTQQINSLNIAYETEKKDRDILMLNKQGQLKDVELSNGRTIRNLLTAGGILALAVIGLGYNRYRMKQRSNLLLTAQQVQISRQNQDLQYLLEEKNTLITEKDHLISDKDLLLKEVHHRVKNNLHIVMSLLESQSAYLENNEALEALLESQNRVRAIALIHQQLYSDESITKVAMRSYIPDLIDYLQTCLFAEEQRITISQSIDNIILDVVQAMPVGIILNEAVTNAIKYAFHGKPGGEIHIEMKRIGEMILLEIADNGIGLPKNFEIKNSKSLGMNLMRGLTKQLNGTFSISTKYGASIVIQFAIADLESD